jgi:siroheme synthase (precorrin-2 oxidase/ferrochelatase)
VNSHSAFFPMLVNLQGRKCVVVGAGNVAADKIAGLLGLGAELVVVSPRAVQRIRNQVRTGAHSVSRM